MSVGLPQRGADLVLALGGWPHLILLELLPVALAISRSLPPHPIPPHEGEGGDGLLRWVYDLNCGSGVFWLGLCRGLLAGKKRGGLHAARSIVLGTGTS